jgi:hypothetical protein
MPPDEIAGCSPTAVTVDYKTPGEKLKHQARHDDDLFVKSLIPFLKTSSRVPRFSAGRGIARRLFHPDQLQKCPPLILCVLCGPSQRPLRLKPLFHSQPPRAFFQFNLAISLYLVTSTGYSESAQISSLTTRLLHPLQAAVLEGDC